MHAENPLTSRFGTPYGTPPFDKIKIEDFKPAITEAIKLHHDEIEAIASQQDKPGFKNTIEAFDRSGRLLDSVTSIFFNLLNADSNDELMELSHEIMPVLSEHYNNISLNEALFGRIKQVYDMQDSLALTQEQKTLLKNSYKSMLRSGAASCSRCRCGMYSGFTFGPCMSSLLL